MIITIARECGSGGHEIGEILSKKLGIPLYDKQRFIEETKQRGLYEAFSAFYDEAPVNSLLYAIAKSNGDTTVQKRSLELIQEIVGDQSAIIIGRCSNFIFKDYIDTTSAFIHADREYRINRLMDTNKITEKEATYMVDDTDSTRAAFHKYCTGQAWRDVSGYEITLNAGLIGTDNAAQIILDYIENKGK